VTRRAYVYFALTFILGVIVGGAGLFYYGWYSGRWKRDFDVNRVVARMKRDLSLDDSQVDKLRLILQDSSRKRKELTQKNQPQFDALHEETRNQIRKILNPDQLAKFNEHVRLSDERLKKQRPGP
jgi:Spy/CpxP family protein refolding chaperone